LWLTVYFRNFSSLLAHGVDVKIQVHAPVVLGKDRPLQYSADV